MRGYRRFGGKHGVSFGVVEDTGLGPSPRADQRFGKVQRLVVDARPEEDFVGAPAFLGVDAAAQSFRLRRVPDLAEGFLADIANRRMHLAEADVAVGVNDTAHDTGAAGNDLRLLLSGLHLGPLQHRLDERAVALFLARRPQSPGVLIQLLVRRQVGEHERLVLALAANQRQVVMVHGGAALVQVRGQALDLVKVLRGDGGDGMDAQSRLGDLQFRQRLVGFQQLGKGLGVAAEAVAVLGHAVDGKFTDEELEALFLEDAVQRFDGALGEVSIGGHIDLLDAVVLDEEAADFGELRAQKGFAAGEIQVLNASQIAGESEDLVHRQVIALIEVSPVETVLAGQVADGVDEQNQKRRRADAWKSEVLPSKLTVPDDALNRVHWLSVATQELGLWFRIL